MGYVFNLNDASAYEEWLDTPKNRSAAALEHQLMLEMLGPLPGQRILDVGCGTGASLMPFLDTGVQLTGIDPSSHMLEIASKKLENRVDLHMGTAEDLPFDDNAFHHVLLVKTLEFTDDPQKSLEEALRVTKDKLFIGIMNRYSVKTTGMRIRRMFIRNFYKQARFFSIGWLVRMAQTMLGEVPISWRTTCLFSSGAGTVTCLVEKLKLIQYCPFGAFAGIVVVPKPRFRARPLGLPCHAGTPEKVVEGLARTHWREKS